MNKCKKCGKIKNAKEFRRLNKHECKECLNKRNCEWRKNNPDKIRDYYMGRKKRMAKYQNKWRKKNPHIYRVAILVFTAIKKREIFKPEICKICKKKKRIVAHHEDYDCPFKIIWLCDSCHIKIHKRRNK